MPTLKQLINRYIYVLAISLTILSNMVVLYFQIIITQNQAYSEAHKTFLQIEQIISENEEELAIITEEYRQTCLLNAKVISHIVEADPAILHDDEALRTLAKNLEIDEIHFFDGEGYIIGGTHPQYYGYSMDSGEQIHFFKPLLTDKSLELIQEITPNTTGHELMQYSALWSKNQKYIIQVGMRPVNVNKVTEKNELSYVFSRFRVNPSTSYYAIDSTTGEIIGSTQTDTVGYNCSDIGFDLNDIKYSEKGTHVDVNGESCYCFFYKIGSNYITYAVPTTHLYSDLPTVMGFLFLCALGIAITLTISFNEYIKIHVIEKIQKVNAQLTSITNGNLNQIVDVRNVHEFSELSSHINHVVQNLSSSNAKLTHIMSKHNLFVGTYEYSEDSDTVRFSEYTPALLNLDHDSANDLSSHPDKFKKFLMNLSEFSVKNEKNVFEIGNKFIRVDEIVENNYVLGIVIDVTDDVVKRQKLTYEVHLDSLTGLFNMIGLEEQLSKLFTTPDKLGHFAIFTIMTDNLIQINNSYGRNNGDRHLQNIANLITDFGTKESIAARKGGGEFILFIYGYENEQSLSKAINLLSYIQHHSVSHLDMDTDIPVDFTFGYATYTPSDSISYQQLLQDSNNSNFEGFSK